MPSLLEYLTLPNANVDRTALRSGTNTLPTVDYDVEGTRPWTDFTREIILDCFSDILYREISNQDLHYPPQIAQHHLKLTDESCVETILKKHNHVIINRALELAEPLLDSRHLCLPISMSWGSLASLEEDSRLRPDWAGTVHSGSPPYQNRVPGDTKQSAKWNSSLEAARPIGLREEYWKPIRQVLLYCIVTDKEVLLIRRTKSQDPPEPLSTNRPRREISLTHNRVASINSVISGTSMMSLDSSGSPYTDEGNPDINKSPLEIAVVPWKNAGSQQLTVNLAIWFIHLLATSEISVEESYHTLGSWQKGKDAEGRQYCYQEGSRRMVPGSPPRKT